MEYNDVNKELLLGFIDESMDALTAADSLFVELERDPQNIELVNAIFRPIHSLKGNAAYFGLMRLKKLAHTMENLLDMVRKGQRHVDRSVIDVLFPGMDLLRLILSKVRDGDDEIEDEKEYLYVISNIDVLLETHQMKSTKDFVSEISENLAKLKENIAESGLQSYQNLIKLLSSALQVPNLIESSHAVKNVTEDSDMKDVISKLKTTLNSANTFQKDNDNVDGVASLIYQMQDLSGNCDDKDVVEEIADVFETFRNSDAGLDELAISLILDKLDLIKLNKIKETVSDDNHKSKESLKHRGIADQKSKNDKTMRIPENALDEFLWFVGELLGVEEMLRHALRQLSDGADCELLYTNLKGVTSQFEEISRELRSKIMEIRKVEAKVLLQKVPRIVRDIAVQDGKKINIECIGESITIDKSYVDLLDAPLTHMVRNAADHGIEIPSVRLKNGKTETGKITVSFIECEDTLKLVIQDDGDGINYDGLRKKGIELGIVDEKAMLSNDDVTDLLFYSGVSTAKVVTDVSGRGVGMDVVKRTVIETGGKIDVSSNAGIGTAFTITLPRNASTQILDGYIVRSFSDEVYVIPLSNVIEAFSIVSEEICDVSGKGKVISRRGTLNPVYTIDNLIGMKFKGIDLNNSFDNMGVLVEVKSKRNVIAVKEIIGIQKIVSKRVDGGLLDKTYFEGAAVSGTGHIYMIINIERLFSMKESSYKEVLTN